MDNAAVKGDLEVFTTAIGAVKALISLASPAKNNELTAHVDGALAILGDARQTCGDSVCAGEG